MLAVAEEAFGGPHVVSLVAAGDTAASIVAEDGSDLAGHVQLSRGWVDAPERLVDVLILSPLAGRPARQGLDIGTALVHAAVAAATQDGAPAVLLEGDPRYNGPRGYEVRRSARPHPPVGADPEAAF